jgi:MFS superfamily sulfate permease-like transporter
MTIGANQLKNAFGLFSKVPQLGDTIDGVEYHYNYQIYKWLTKHWYDEDSSGRSYHNPIAIRICFGLFIPLMILNLIKIHWKVSKETKKTTWYRLIIFAINTLPLAAIIIGANIAWRLFIKANIIYDPVSGEYGQFDTSTQTIVSPTNLYEFYISKLRIVGEIPSGLSILRKPSFDYPWSSFFLAVLPLTLINYMEAYSVARRIAYERKELHLLSANQELYALGLANLVGCAATSYPVTGSYSRSALNNAAGAKTPLSKLVCLCVVLLALGVLTPYFYFIPPSALSAIIWVSIYNLLSFSDLWEAWKHHKIDFFVMLITLVMTFTFDTAIGLAAGVAGSFLAHFYNTVFSPKATPEAVDSDPQLFTRAVSCEGIQVISFNGDLTFLTAPRLRDYFSTFFVMEPVIAVETETRNEYYFRQITSSLDWFYGKIRRSSDNPIPGIFTLDFTKVVFLDISGLQALAEIVEEGHTAGVRFYFINLREDIKKMMIKFGVKADVESKEDLAAIMYSYNI